jgi:sirohydrochlorin cobaltochelatase
MDASIKTVIVLAMHGIVPTDFPESERNEFFSVRAQLARAAEPDRPELERRLEKIHTKMRRWPRTPRNDPYFAGSQELAGHLGRVTGRKVIFGFYEFCAPSLDEALDQAVGESNGKVLVVTPMMTRGGSHSELDIPAVIKKAKERHPEAPIEYVWPFEMADVARFLSREIDRRIDKANGNKK